jgi:hypothetical protein
MNTSTANRSFFGISTLPLIAALLFSVVTSFFQIAQAASVNGRNVNVVSVDNGTFRQVSRKSWVEQNKQGQRVFSFKETHRDAWSVYLHDASRNVRLQLDMHRKIVGYSDANNPTKRDLYRITSGSSKMSGWLVKRVNVQNGSFVYKGNKRWVEKDASNKTVFRFTEVARDDWSVYMKDGSRNVNIQLDLHTRKVMYSVGNAPRTPLYNIKRIR